MIRINSPFGKSVAVFSTFTLVFCLVPGLAWAKTAQDAKAWVKSQLPPVTPDSTPSKILSAKTMKMAQGKSGENPYAAGQNKWDVMYKGVDLMTGNFTMSATDLKFEDGYGIPVNVTRSYSANNAEEGPLGKGWNLSVDVRSTAGGILKSSGAPVRSVPTNFKERPPAQIDPNAVYGNGTSGGSSTSSPVTAVMATDSAGTEETIQRDADGILSTPPWDKNKIDSEYETKIVNGVNYQIMTKNYVNTPEGTVYVYEKEGDYGTAGVVPFDNPSASGEPSNVLKITSATDRHGNVTTYTYGSGTVSFVKSNGTTTEHPLTQVQMPNGHHITFGWTGNRLTSATDGVRTVYYGYDPYSSEYLTSFTSAGGKTTTYGYGNAVENYNYGPDAATGLLTSTTDCRGLTTSISYTMEFVPRYGWTPAVRRQVAPNGLKTDYFFLFDGATGTIPVTDVFDYMGADYDGTAGQGPYDLVHGFEIVQNVSSSTFSVIARQTNTTYVVFTGGSDLYQKDYDIPSQNLMTDTERVFDHSSQPSRFHSAFQPGVDGPVSTNYTTTTNAYNFMGNPLEKTVSQYSRNSSGSLVLDKTTTSSYAYWGAEKYYQQKSVKDSYGRLSYTDYYDDQATTGKKGQTYRVYDQARATIWLNPNPTPAVPSYAASGTEWRYQVEVSDPSDYSAQFDYDSKGRAIDVWKVQTTSTSPYTYVRTHTSYGADTDGSWGQANEVIEDYGGINRTTDTLAYDTVGRAVTVQDASGKVFHTTYLNDDDQISTIERVDGSTSTPVVTYTYGSSGITNGQVLSVTDNLSGVSQSMTYSSSGVSIGLPTSVAETNGSDSYSTSYTYNWAGDRDMATYVTESALGLSDTVKWQYHDYVDVGAEQSGRIFQTLTNIDASTGDATSEEFQYAVDSAGRPRQLTFAMTPQSWTPSNGASYYDSSHKAATRGRTFYVYNGSGQVTGLYNWWDTYNSGTNSYDSTPIRANECVYETTGLKRGLKTSNKFYNVSSGSWNLQRTETYGYDANLDYLTSANYGDGLSNATPSWTYDAAGNRASDSTNSGTWSYDNLNRMTAMPGVTVGTMTNDILGNRTAKSVSGVSTSYGWDDLNRMTSLTVGSAATNYVYRADGLRVSKSSSSGSTLYRYDGQMGIEDVEKDGSGTITAVTRNALGARCVDAISRTTSLGTTVAYPLYDAHGNNVGMLSKSGSSWSLSDERTYDAWGVVRVGSATGTQSGRYCANIGHKQDDESGLVYMRARYYEATSGRFISQDISKAGNNWFCYVNNIPLDQVDISGREGEGLGGILFELFKGLIKGDFDNGHQWNTKQWLKLGVKTALGYQEGLVSSWAVRTIVAIGDEMVAGYNAAMASGGGMAAEAIADEGSYAILLVLFIDAIDILGSEALVDVLFDGGEKTNKWLNG
ncbi:MAG: RHS repeat-associated core domain-containing protein [Armatimonadetes bacterium]|nr:RHS repeat-associated core domain-containing protein [Armatimonadota bacterium]